MDKDMVNELLNDWTKLNVFLKDSNEEDTLKLLEQEKKRPAGGRRTVISRIHHRYNLLRGRRERTELIPG